MYIGHWIIAGYNPENDKRSDEKKMVKSVPSTARN